MTPPQDSVSDVERLRARQWHSPELRDLHGDTEQLRNHRLGGKRWMDLLQGVLDMLAAADVEIAAEDSAALAVPINKIGEDATDAVAACLYGHFYLRTAYNHEAGRVLSWPELPADSWYRRACVEAAAGVLDLPAIRRLSTSTDKGVR